MVLRALSDKRITTPSEEAGHSRHILRMGTTTATNPYQYDEFGRKIVYTPITILSDALLPGKGQKGKNCGKISAIGVCEACGNVVYLRSSCYQPLCPSCWHKWRMRRAVSILTKLDAFRRYRYSITRIGRY